MDPPGTFPGISLFRVGPRSLCGRFEQWAVVRCIEHTFDGERHMRVRRRRQDGSVSFELLDDQEHPIPEVAGFLRHLDARDCSPNTLSAYAHDLLHLYRFLADVGLTLDDFGPP